MPRPSKGEKTPGSGRQPGQPNRDTRTVEAIIAAKGVSPHEAMCDIVLGNVECNVCRGSLFTKYILEDGKHTKECSHNQKETQSDSCICNGIGTRPCASCNQTGYEKISPDLRGKMAAELAQYIAPKRKAVEHTGAEGGAIEHSLLVEFVSGPKLLSEG